MRLKYTAALSLIMLAGLSGCNREATGQVAAVVNGDEITLQEVNAEIAGLQLPESVDKKVIQQQAIQRILERRLLAQAAAEEGMDSSQDYLIRERQLRDNLLVQLLGERLERTTKPPEPAELDRYIAENPGLFKDRKIFSVDRIQFPAPADMNKLKSLEDDHSMAAVATRLSGMGIEFRRGEGQIDTAAIGPALLKQLLALPPGEPFVVPENGIVTIGVITGERTAPLAGEDARTLALRSLRSKQVNDAVRQRLEQARSKAEISYQAGFGPPAAGEQGKKVSASE
ncbi:SurA N-terminal domain-containing protein [Erythrobacter sp.]|uniref:SurA N-terminal domain-containing protein n=1 Tax=Erythrobacter sp. TaxID=1042 RepID=UPI0025ED4B7B|nr:SurA N-terminal domain-containing protein [Erythrobacter sp.]